MSRLHAELSRLFAWHAPTAPASGCGTATPAAAPAATPADGQQEGGTVRCLVLALGAPAEWPALAPLWRGVQADLDWPAPAIAVNGLDAFELWFSLAQPVPVAEAALVLNGLRQRYLGTVPASRVRCWPGPGPGSGSGPGSGPGSRSGAGAAQPVPVSGERAPGRWSAFVAPDLAAVFGDDPSLDLPPGEEAQAELLARLRCVSAAGWQAARQGLAAGATAALAPDAGAPVPGGGAVSGVCEDASQARLSNPSDALAERPAQTAGADPVWLEARRFLRGVMSDETVPLALRIEAAKALLQAPAGRTSA